jgi:hypothetical protein
MVIGSGLKLPSKEILKTLLIIISNNSRTVVVTESGVVFIVEPMLIPSSNMKLTMFCIIEKI